MDESHTPLYPFGYGLSYAKFDYSDLKIQVEKDYKVNVSVQVKNTSEIDGEEIVQLYIRDRVASIVRPVKELKGFEKTMIKAGATTTFSFTLTEKELGFYNGEGEYLVEPGDFDLWVGPNSSEGLHDSFKL